jgi:hypothetical protein
MMDAFWAVPEWAPQDESHLLGSLSVVTKIAYGAGSVTYSTFDAESTDVLRLDFVPVSISAGGKPLARRTDLASEGYLFDDKAHTLTIRHTSSKDIDIQGSEGQKQPSYVTFDQPHLAAGTPLAGQYPTGVADWGTAGWKIATPSGKFSTFTLAVADPEAKQAEFSFPVPYIFVGIDISNDGDHDATLSIRSPENREVNITVKAKQVVRFRSGWRDPSSRVSLSITGGQGLRFDNLAYLRP